MAMLKTWKANVAFCRRKVELARAVGLAGTPVAAASGAHLDAHLDEFSAPEGPFGRADLLPATPSPTVSDAPMALLV